MRLSSGWLIVLAITAACRSQPQARLNAAGDDHDEGHGILARASTKMMTSPEDPRGDVPAARRVTRAPTYDDYEYAGAIYGGDGYGGMGEAAYGGATYAGYIVPQWPYPSVNRIPAYGTKNDLRGAIEGTIAWRGTTPTLTTACGPITPVRTGAKNTLAGAVVYLERVAIGRAPIYVTGEMRPVTVGGVVVKRGCAFTPGVQMVTPVPAQVSIHGDRKATRIALAQAAAPRRVAELQEAGRVVLQMKTGVLAIESEDGTLGAAYVLGLDTPAYAVTDEAGRFRIDELAPGAYDLVVWHPPVPKLVDGKLVYGDPIVSRRSVRLDRERTVHVDVTIGAK